MNYSKYIFPPGNLFIDIPSRGYCPQRLNPFEKAETDRDNIRKVSTIKPEEIAEDNLNRKDQGKIKQINKELFRDMTADEQALEMLKKYAP